LLKLAVLCGREIREIFFDVINHDLKMKNFTKLNNPPLITNRGL
jgi:hypothetical protein